MRESRVAKGVHVIIADNLDKTESEFGVGHEMLHMRGKNYIIQGYHKSIDRFSVEIHGFDWHPDDLLEDSPSKKKQTFHFDVKELQL